MRGEGPWCRSQALGIAVTRPWRPTLDCQGMSRLCLSRVNGKGCWGVACADVCAATLLCPPDALAAAACMLPAVATLNPPVPLWGGRAVVPRRLDCGAPRSVLWHVGHATEAALRFSWGTCSDGGGTCHQVLAQADAWMMMPAASVSNSQIMLTIAR